MMIVIISVNMLPRSIHRFHRRIVSCTNIWISFLNIYIIIVNVSYAISVYN